MPLALEQGCWQGPRGQPWVPGQTWTGFRGQCRCLASTSATPGGCGVTVVIAHRAARPCFPLRPLRVRGWGSWSPPRRPSIKAQYRRPVPGVGTPTRGREPSRRWVTSEPVSGPGGQ